MKTHRSSSKSSWFWKFQIAVGSICIILSIVVMLYGARTTAGAYIWLFLAGIGLMLNIGVGAGLIIYIGSGFFFPAFATKYLILFLGFGLLANGIIRIISGLKKKEEESFDLPSITTGIVIGVGDLYHERLVRPIRIFVREKTFCSSRPLKVVLLAGGRGRQLANFPIVEDFIIVCGVDHLKSHRLFNESLATLPISKRSTNCMAV
jgi:hypothetical protein